MVVVDRRVGAALLISITVCLLAVAASWLEILRFDSRTYYSSIIPRPRFGYDPGSVIVVDLGNTNSCVSGYRGEAMFRFCIPSWVAFTGDGAALVGEAAKNHAYSNPEAAIFGFKRLLGRWRYRIYHENIVQGLIERVPYKIGADPSNDIDIQVKVKDGTVKHLRVEDIASMVVAELKKKAEEHLGHEVQDAVITIPQHFPGGSRDEAMKAGRSLGLEIESAFSEPVAAAVAYGLSAKLRENGNALVLHVGGGTAYASAVSLMDGGLYVIGHWHEEFFGGDDFDQRIMDHFVKLIRTKHGKDISEDGIALRRLGTACERAKKALSSQDHVQVTVPSLFDGVDFSEPLSRPEFEELNDDLFRKVIAMVDRVMLEIETRMQRNKNMIDEVVLVGGSTMIPRIQKLIKVYFDGKEPNVRVKPDEAVTIGAAIIAHAPDGTYRFKNFSPRSQDGAFHFPVFHRKHPCVLLDDDQSVVDAESVTDVGIVIRNDEIHKGKYLMGISLGTPAVFNLVAIDTGSSLSWVQCEPCQISCHKQAPEAGQVFDPRSSTTYRSVSCSDDDCAAVHDDHGVPFGCIEQTDTCLYGARYASQYSAGKLGRDRLALGRNFTVAGDFLFGCSEDDHFAGKEAGVVGLGSAHYSFFTQMAAKTSYRAFAYCFPGDHGAEGFMAVGPYPPSKLELVTPLIGGYGGSYPHAYSVQQLDMMVDGRRLEVDPSVYRRQMMIVDSGADDTYVLSPVFDALDWAMTAAMEGRGYVREYHPRQDKLCFASTRAPVSWRGLPVVEMKFIRAVLRLPPENVFHAQSANTICLAFKAHTAGVRGVQILGNKATRSFRVVHDLQKMTFGFQDRAC
ncbi:hypothetical protein ACP4OV_003209 [Aristida adscensionis]